MVNGRFVGHILVEAKVLHRHFRQQELCWSSFGEAAPMGEAHASILDRISRPSIHFQKFCKFGNTSSLGDPNTKEHRL